jgi:predicted nucleic acid-binding protein
VRSLLFDTHAWIEFFRGTPKGVRVRDLLAQGKAFASEATAAELTIWALRNGFNPDRYLASVERLATFIPLTRDALVAAGKVSYERKKSSKEWGLLDGMVYATARLNDLEVVTGDEDFAGLPGVVLL